MRELKVTVPLDVTPLIAVLEQWPTPLLLFDADARLHWCNSHARQMVSTHREELAGLGAASLGLAWLMAPEQFIAALGGEEQKFCSGPVDAPQRFDISLRRVDLGGVRPAVLCSLTMQSAPSKEVLASEREQSFDAAHAGLWRWNVESNQASVDEAWCAYLNLSPCSGGEHTVRWTMQVHPDDSADYRRRLEEIRNGSSPVFEDEYRILTLDNRWVWILQRGRVVAHSLDGRPLQVLGICIDIDRRKREETALKENEGRLATALWGARAAFWQWNVPTDIRTLSPMWFAITGYSREEWDRLRDPWLSRLHPDDREPVIAAVKRYCEGSVDSLEYEYRLQIANGEWKWLLDRARAVEWDLDGNPAMIMGVSLDIDAQKRAEMALHESEVRLQTAVWGARMGLWETDFVANTTHWFDQWCAQYGIDPCEGVDAHGRWVKNVHPADVIGASRRYEDHLAGKHEFYDAEYRVRGHDGQWRWVYARGRVTERDEQQKPLRMVGVCLDIDARRQIEMQEHFTQPWLEAALQVGRSGMWYWQMESREITYTDSYYRLFGVDPLVGRTQARYWVENIHPDDRDRAMSVAQNVMDGHVPTYEQEYRMRGADGQWIWVLDRACAISRDENGRAQDMAGFVIDFTERRRQREALRASEQMFRYATLAAGGMIVELDFVSGQLKRYGGERLLGYPNGEMAVKRELWESVLHPDDIAHFNAFRDRHNTRGHQEVIEYRVRHQAGHYVRMRSAGITFTDNEGQAVRRISFLQPADSADSAADAGADMPARTMGFHNAG
jgi:PAS domain S-box-containing protein